MYIHSPLGVTGYAGTVSGVNVSLNQSVYASTTLFTLTDTSTSASYDALLQNRSQLEEDLLELLRIQQYGGLTAPISGSVYAAADLDETETGGEEAVELITLAPDAQMSVTISVDESDILSLALDQTADVTVSSISDDVLTGTVTEIDKTASDGTYTAVITLDKRTGMLPGMTASAFLTVDTQADALCVPAAALERLGSQDVVYTGYDADSQTLLNPVAVTIGASDGDMVQILEGLEEGSQFYYAYYEADQTAGSSQLPDFPDLP